MAYSSSSYSSPFGGFSITPWVKRLLIANVAVFLLLLIMGGLKQTVLPFLWFRPAALPDY